MHSVRHMGTSAAVKLTRFLLRMPTRGSIRVRRYPHLFSSQPFFRNQPLDGNSCAQLFWNGSELTQSPHNSFRGLRHRDEFLIRFGGLSKLRTHINHLLQIFTQFRSKGFWGAMEPMWKYTMKTGAWTLYPIALAQVLLFRVYFVLSSACLFSPRVYFCEK